MTGPDNAVADGFEGYIPMSEIKKWYSSTYDSFKT
jgi:hypothetical protein